MRTLLLIALLALGSLLLLRLSVPRLARFFIYHPEPLRPQESEPRFWGFPGAADIRLRTEDGVELHAWWFPAYSGLPRQAAGPGAGAGTAAGSGTAAPKERSGKRRGVAIYFHGNAGHLAYRGEIAAALSALGLDVMLLDYRGYGLSGGRADEAGLYLDGEAARRAALERSGFGPERLLLIGNSLGSAVAVEVARRRPVAGLILLGPFTSTVAVGRHTLRWLPEWMLDWQEGRFDLLARVPEVSAPALIAVGSEDHMIPEEEARRVFEAKAGSNRWYVARGAGHNEVWSHPGVWHEVQTFVREVLPWDEGG